MRRAILAAALVTATYFLTFVPFASAEGGTTIASAPTVAYGQQEFGNTANGGHIETTCHGAGPLYYLFWDLPVTIDDSVTIDWEAAQPRTELELYPIGTTDFNFGSGSNGFQTQTPAGNGKNELSYVASEGSGTVILAFRNCYYEPGAFSFTAYVTHALTLAVPHRTLHGRGTIAVAVHNPEGGAVNDPSVHVEVQIRTGRGRWRHIGDASVSNSAAVVHYRIPPVLRHQDVVLRAVAFGSDYKRATSAIVRTRTR